MKCKIPEISWHNRDPVLSVDIQPKQILPGDKIYNLKHRLASGGTDAHVLIWYMNYTENGNDIELDLAADLTRHQRAVNAVSWSPSGEFLASGDDESVVFIWKQKGDQEPVNILDNTNEQDKEVWIVLKVLRGHMEDIYDLSWAPNSQFLVSGSVDNTAIIWDVHKGKSLGMLRDHKSFVQGVAWDPKNQYIATLSSDRYLRIFDIQTKRVLYRINKSTLPVGEGHQLHGQRMPLFHDDTLQTFFRRLCFTPDGKLLLAPAGVAEVNDVAQSLNTTYIFSRHAFRQPAIVLPCPGQYTVAVRCCPILFRLRPHKVELNPPVVPLPYRMIFAVATRSSVYFYDTQQRQPFAVISNIHYTRLTDVTWSSDGRIVVVSSTDGFCSLITFEAGELGEEYQNAAEILSVNDINAVVKKVKKQKENDGGQSTKERKPSTEEQKDITVGPTIRDPLGVISEEQISGKAMKENKSSGEIEEQNPTEAMEVEVSNNTFNKTKNISSDEDKKNTVKRTDKAENSLPSGNTAAAVITKTLGATIIIDKEILSSDERFESPEKKSRPATSIMIRRTPRSATLPNTVKTFNTPTSNNTPKSATNTPTRTLETTATPSPKPNVNATRQSKNKATPIQVRRTPRAIISTSAPPALIAATISTEEIALDAWPTPMDATDVEDEEKTLQAKATKTTKDNQKPKQQPTEYRTSEIADITKSIDNNVSLLECTEDIRLVYEDSIDNSMTMQAAKGSTGTTDITTKSQMDHKCAEENVLAGTPSKSGDTAKTPLSNNKTPRRVALKTISTPKSKKKLLE